MPGNLASLFEEPIFYSTYEFQKRDYNIVWHYTQFQGQRIDFTQNVKPLYMGLDYGMVFIQADAIHALKRRIRWNIYDETFIEPQSRKNKFRALPPKILVKQEIHIFPG